MSLTRGLLTTAIVKSYLSRTIPPSLRYLWGLGVVEVNGSAYLAQPTRAQQLGSVRVGSFPVGGTDKFVLGVFRQEYSFPFVERPLPLARNFQSRCCYSLNKMCLGKVSFLPKKGAMESSSCCRTRGNFTLIILLASNDTWRVLTHPQS